MYNDPIYPTFIPVKPVRLWPYVLAGMLCALALWAYLEPIPEHSRPEPMVIQVP